ncbi:FMN reductase [Halobacteriales archaeon QS_9_68_17]|nr:MAG: FMN reductase [Halobacteriales archaeon QS_9_68_17]
MPEDVRVVGIAGSLREGSASRKAVDHALDETERAGASTELLDLREYDLPMIDPDEDDPEDAKRLKASVREADSILLASPMYHGSYSSPLKTALDYCGFDEFENKTVGLLAVAGGSFPITALEHLRSVCRALDAWVIPHQAAVPKSHSAFSDGAFVDDGIEGRVRELGRQAVQYANIEPDPESFESEENVGAVNQ